MKNKLVKLNNVTIGSDLEFFITDSENNIISGINRFGGTKDKPKYIGEGCYIQEDNILGEANIPPVVTKQDFIKYINYIKNYVNEVHPDVKILYSSSEYMPPELSLDAKANIFGCDPSLIVDYNDEGDEIPEFEHEQMIEQKTMSLLRTGGFHIHIGYDNPTQEKSREIVKLFEKNVTLPLMKYDIDKYNRRQSYGKAGEYRIKPYGLECRSLGSALLRDDELLSLVWDGVMKTIEDFNSGERVSKQEFEIIKEIINN